MIEVLNALCMTLILGLSIVVTYKSLVVVLGWVCRDWYR